MRGWTIDRNPDIPDQLIIASKAKITDVQCLIDFGDFVQGFILNDKLLDLLLNFNLPIYRTYELNLYHKGKRINNYYFFVIYDECNKYVDFNKSKFYWNHHSEKKMYEDLIVNSSKELKDLFYNSVVNSNPFKTIGSNKIVLNKKFNFDMLRIHYLFPPGYYVSKRLKEAIEKEGITGILFEEAPHIEIEK